MTEICVRTSELAGVVVATPVGRLDLSTYAALRDGLLKQAAAVPLAIVVRLGPDFESASRAMLAVFTTVWMRISQWPGVPLVLVAETEEHHSDLRRSGVTRHVATATDLEATLDRAEQPPLRRYRRLTLPKSLVAALIAREEVRVACAEWELPGLVDDALLVVSELVENAVRHSGSEPALRIELRASGLSLAVRDDNPEPPVTRSAAQHRGLDLVGRTSVAWGTMPSYDGGKVVWAVLALGPRR
ncbi:ATP-binding protein [Lentzea sp. NPDC060358]|uniref:ATP-binding protein n=1 Tax=Lentzea sp. NPDC060358 TaxID=3347103 RepID=UPI00364BB4CC